MRSLFIISILMVLASLPAAADTSQHLSLGRSSGLEITGPPPALWDGTTPENAAAALANITPDIDLLTRGSKEAEIYRKFSPSVVMIVTDQGLGSGILIAKDGSILTNFHVVEGFTTVGVVFKPKVEGEAPTEADIVRGDVIAVEPGRDLALVRVAAVPSGIKPLRFSNGSDIQVGTDVHAIGHPTGEAWTYTKGIISQVRKDYEWSDENGGNFRADVIQTQTPINPGNSGGPLLDDEGKLVGVNSFINADAEGINYAISITTVALFLEDVKAGRAQAAVAALPQKSATCQLKTLTSARDKEYNDGYVAIVDLDCDGRGDATLFTPDDQKNPVELWLDYNGDGNADVVIVDDGRDGCWDYSYLDSNYDGVPDLEGQHYHCQIVPDRVVPYKASN